MTRRPILSFLALAIAYLGCRGHDETGVVPSATVTAAPSAAAPAAAPSAAAPSAAAPAAAPAPPREAAHEGSAPPPPLPGFFESLPVPGHPDAWLSLPTGATGKRPVVVVIHGVSDKPEWQCGGWRHATAEYPFVVCPRGAFDPRESTKRDTRYTLRGGAELLSYIDATLAALEARYPNYADVATPLLAGFSLGASQILALAVQDPARFPRIALVEGATSGWTDARIDAYVKGGGERVLYAAGQRGNEMAAKATGGRLRARGLDARVVYAPVDHTFAPPLEDAVHAELGWLVAGDARWTL